MYLSVGRLSYSTRRADTGPMQDVLVQTNQTAVIAQTEEPAGVEDIEGIAAVEGVDGIFIGQADLSVGYGYNHQTSGELFAAFERYGAAAKAKGKTYMSWVANGAKAKGRSKYGVSMYFIGSEHSWMLWGANVDAASVHEI